MSKILGNRFIILPNGQTGAVDLMNRIAIAAGIKLDPVCDPVFLINVYQPVRTFQTDIQTDIFLRSVVMRFKGVSAEVDGSLIVEL